VWWCLRSILPLAGALAGACSDEYSGDKGPGENVASQQQALTLAVPNRIRALDFDGYYDTTSQHFGTCGSGPVDAETTSEPGSGGCNIGWTAPGETLDYTISVATAGKYNFVPRVASANAGKNFRVLLDGQEISGLISTPSNGWQAFASREVKNVTVGAGTHTLRVKFETNETNLAYIDVTPGTVDLPHESRRRRTNGPTSRRPARTPETRVIGATAWTRRPRVTLQGVAATSVGPPPASGSNTTST